MSIPMISVVMPVYNAEKYLNEAIQSILTQTYKDFELIIINDGSSDKSLEIIEKYQNQDERIVLISRENRGLVASLNEGIEKSRGKYIARMDADDISLPERFEKQLELMKKDNLDLCGTHFIFIDENNKYLDARVVSTEHKFIKVILSRSVPFAHGSVMIKKDFLIFNKLKYGLTKYDKAEDYALWIQCYENNAKFGNVDKFLFLYRDTENTMSKNSINYLHAKKLSEIFIDNNKNLIFEIITNNKTRLNIFEQEHVSFFILKNLVQLNFVKAFRILKTIPFKFNLINLFRVLFR